MSQFDDALTERFMAASSGGTYDVEVNADGYTTYIPSDYVDIAAEDQLNPFAIQGEVKPRTPAQFAGDVGAGAAGVATGAASVTAGLPGDVAGLIKGIGAAFQADEGNKLMSFMDTVATESEQWGSEFFVQKFEALADQMLTPEQSAAFKGASDFVGQMAEIPGALTGMFKGIAKANRYAESAAGPTSRQIPSQPKIDVETTPVDTKLLFEKLDQRTNLQDLTPAETKAIEADLKTGQLDIGGSAAEIITAAKANQASLAKTGEAAAKELNIEFKNPGIKGALDKGARLQQKAAEKGGIHQLTDVTRAGFAVRSTDDADAVVNALADQYKIIDEGFNVTPLGYFDRKILVINKDGQVGEVQIWPSEMYSAKIENGGQDLYTLWRGKRIEDMTAKEKTATRKLAKKYGITYNTTEELRGAAKEKSIELYADALKKLDPSMKGIVTKQLDEIATAGGADSELAIKMLDIMTTPNVGAK